MSPCLVVCSKHKGIKLTSKSSGDSSCAGSESGLGELARRIIADLKNQIRTLKSKCDKTVPHNSETADEKDDDIEVICKQSEPSVSNNEGHLKEENILLRELNSELKDKNLVLKELLESYKTQQHKTYAEVVQEVVQPVINNIPPLFVKSKSKEHKDAALDIKKPGECLSCNPGG